MLILQLRRIRNHRRRAWQYPLYLLAAEAVHWTWGGRVPVPSGRHLWLKISQQLKVEPRLRRSCRRIKAKDKVRTANLQGTRQTQLVCAQETLFPRWLPPKLILETMMVRFHLAIRSARHVKIPPIQL